MPTTSSQQPKLGDNTDKARSISDTTRSSCDLRTVHARGTSLPTAYRALRTENHLSVRLGRSLNRSNPIGEPNVDEALVCTRNEFPGRFMHGLGMGCMGIPIRYPSQSPSVPDHTPMDQPAGTVDAVTDQSNSASRSVWSQMKTRETEEESPSGNWVRNSQTTPRSGAVYADAEPRRGPKTGRAPSINFAARRGRLLILLSGRCLALVRVENSEKRDRRRRCRSRLLCFPTRDAPPVLPTLLKLPATFPEAPPGRHTTLFCAFAFTTVGVDFLRRSVSSGTQRQSSELVRGSESRQQEKAEEMRGRQRPRLRPAGVH